MLGAPATTGWMRHSVLGCCRLITVARAMPLAQA